MRLFLFIYFVFFFIHYYFCHISLFFLCRILVIFRLVVSLFFRSIFCSLWIRLGVPFTHPGIVLFITEKT